MELEHDAIWNIFHLNNLKRQQIFYDEPIFSTARANKEKM